MHTPTHTVTLMVHTATPASTATTASPTAHMANLMAPTLTEITPSIKPIMPTLTQFIQTTVIAMRPATMTTLFMETVSIYQNKWYSPLLIMLNQCITFSPPITYHKFMFRPLTMQLQSMLFSLPIMQLQ